MAKLKECSFCKQPSILWYSNPPCCSKGSCKKAYNDSKGKSNTLSSKPKKTYKIKPFADSMLKKLAIYRPLRDKYLEDHTLCEIKSSVCTGLATELHHKKPRAYFLCDVTIFCASCRPCNDFVERHHEWAREKGFKIDHL